jgi:hypothetical protein
VIAINALMLLIAIYPPLPIGGWIDSLKRQLKNDFFKNAFKASRRKNDC